MLCFKIPPTRMTSDSRIQSDTMRLSNCIFFFTISDVTLMRNISEVGINVP